jgi:alkylation response protein AidB-like acyl-CoA dehydrogenase
MAVARLLPTQESQDLVALVRDLADKELGTRVEEHERAETYPEGLFAVLGQAGLLGLPYPEADGGGGQPYEVYLQVLEELAGCPASRCSASAPTPSASGGCRRCWPAR